MARGWESKSVESQMEEAERKDSAPRERFTPEQIALQRGIEGLESSRHRIEREIAESANPRFVALKRKALAHLEQLLADAQQSLARTLDKAI